MFFLGNAVFVNDFKTLRNFFQTLTFLRRGALALMETVVPHEASICSLCEEYGFSCPKCRTVLGIINSSHMTSMDAAPKCYECDVDDQENTTSFSVQRTLVAQKTAPIRALTTVCVSKLSPPPPALPISDGITLTDKQTNAERWMIQLELQANCPERTLVAPANIFCIEPKDQTHARRMTVSNALETMTRLLSGPKHEKYQRKKKAQKEIGNNLRAEGALGQKDHVPTATDMEAAKPAPAEKTVEYPLRGSFEKDKTIHMTTAAKHVSGSDLDSDAGLTAVEGPVWGSWHRLGAGTPRAPAPRVPAPSSECQGLSSSRYERLTRRGVYGLNAFKNCVWKSYGD